MTKQQAIEALKRLLLNIAGEKDCEAIELAIAALQSDPETPDWSQAPRRRAGENDSVTVN